MNEYDYLEQPDAMTFNKFTEDEKAMWLLQMEVLNYPNNEHAPYKIAKQKNAPHARTLRRWWRVKGEPHIDKLVEHKKRDFIEELKNLLGLHIDAAKEAVKGSEDIRAIDTGIGIIVDKLQLLQGEPTERKELNVTDSRDRIMADLAAKSGGYVIGESPELGQKPIA